MDYCKKCKNFGCNAAGTERTTTNCEDYMSHLPTNADRIRAMTDEELAKFMGDLPCCPPGEDVEELCFPLDSCEGTDFKVKCWHKWLTQEAKDGTQN